MQTAPSRISRLARKCVPLAILAIVFFASVQSALAVYITITKQCTDASAPGDPIHFWGTVRNGNVLDVYVDVFDDKVNDFVLYHQFLPSGASVDYSGDYYPTESPSTNTVTVYAYDVFGELRETNTASATCNTPPPPPSNETCRTPGYWGTHAGTENSGVNVTQAVINAVGFLNVCGKNIDNTNLNVYASAEEAICVSIKGDIRLQLARQLTSMALNCVMSGGGRTCADLSIEGLFSECNAACSANVDTDAMESCRKEIDCWNNGGALLDNGMCQTGSCEGSGAPCGKDDDCGLSLTSVPLKCVPTPGNCHDRALVNEDLGLYFDPSPSASSPKKCNDANKNSCSIFSCSAR